jgi:hypothetical protein
MRRAELEIYIGSASRFCIVVGIGKEDMHGSRETERHSMKKK